MTLTRWRKLEGSDPGTYEMLQKIQALQKRPLTLTPTPTLTLTLPQPLTPIVCSGAPPGLLVGGELGGLDPSPKPAAQGGPRSLDEVSAAAVARWETRPY